MTFVMNKKQYYPKLFYLVLIAVGVVVIVAMVMRERSQGEKSVESGVREEQLADLGNMHVSSEDEEHASYNSVPPTSGPHLGSSIAPWGVHTEQISDVQQVHNLEDGGVIIHYDPLRVDEETIDKLVALTNRYTTQIILESYSEPALPSPIVLTAWTRLMKLETFDEDAILSFIGTYRGKDHHVKY